MTHSLPASLVRLHQRITPPVAARLALGDARLDAHLAGGLALGRLHEVLAEGVAAETGELAAAFIACLLARLPHTGPVVWGAPCCDLHPPGLLAYGLDPGRLLLVQTRDDGETLQVMETALREGGTGAGGLAAVVGEIERLPRLAGRRLHLACLACGITGFLLRRQPFGQSVGRKTVMEGSATTTRWRLAFAPTDADRAPRWRAELLQARGGREGSWVLEMADAPNVFRVVAEFSDDAAAPDQRATA
jgi:protein ImuA